MRVCKAEQALTVHGEFHESEAEMDQDVPAFDRLHGAGIADQLKTNFRGTDRKGPKTSIAQGSVKGFSVKAWIYAIK